MIDARASVQHIEMILHITIERCYMHVFSAVAELVLTVAGLRNIRLTAKRDVIKLLTPVNTKF